MRFPVTSSRRRWLQAGASLLALPALGPARAATYPDRPLTLIVPFAAGGPTDIVGRIVAQALGAELGRQVVVDNRGGAAGLIGIGQVARAAPDGYTLGVATVSTHGTLPNLTARMPYDARRDFTPVSNLAASAMALSVHPSVPARTLDEFIAHLRAHPGRLSYGNAGAGGIGDLGMTWFLQRIGATMVSVPYKGSAPALTDLAAGLVQATFDNFPSSLAMIRASHIRPLAITGAQRSPALPALPTFTEGGMPGFDVSAWYGLLGPAGMPADVTSRLNSAVARVLSDPAVSARLADAGATPSPTTPGQFASQIDTEVARWREVIRVAGLKPQ
ncbi:Bug family tripartite tricarboxylate transporter substrate binding protein [Rubrivivax sp. RP6-9]|uniref:Bug family tripartite tricarboxylate transporter substrate binding protein n=1 Tax=Rubrivivax sp. RP6-9 TaxID=3415750 RepID=UPI003CC53C70